MVNKVKFISEIASTHDGNITVLKKLSDLHIKSKSDFLKFQIFNADNLHKKNTKMHKRFKQLEFSFEKWVRLIEFYSTKTSLIIEPFDYESYDFAKKFKNKINLKISASECDNLSLINDSVKHFRKIWINFSGYNLKEIKRIINKIKKNRKIIPMIGFQSYPTLINKSRFKTLQYLSDNFSNTGFADHTDTKKFDENLISIILAILNGASYIEKHVCLNKHKKPPDYISALEFNELNILIKNVELFFEIYSKKVDVLSKEEVNYSRQMRKFAFAKEKIYKNQILKLNQIDFLRSDKPGLNRLDFIQRNYIAKVTIQKGNLIDKKNIRKK